MQQVTSNKIIKKARFLVQGQFACLGPKAQLALPNKFVQAIGPFVFLRHIYSLTQSCESHAPLVEGGSHALRGIAAITYVLTGEVEHIDSIGNHAKLNSGGVHWLNAGKGVLYDERGTSEPTLTNAHLSVVQIWINLPSRYKSETPSYFSLSADRIPTQQLDGDAGWIKVLSGQHANLVASVPNYSKEFLYHVHLEVGKTFSTRTHKNLECAAFLIANTAVINYTKVQGGDLIAFTSLGNVIEIVNESETAIDILLFGGEQYKEPIEADGSFVMNTPHEITQAYNDYYEGKYGQLDS